MCMKNYLLWTFCLHAVALPLVVILQYHIYCNKIKLWYILQQLIIGIWDGLICLMQKTGLLDIKANTAAGNGRCYWWLALETNLFASKRRHYCSRNSVDSRCKTELIIVNCCSTYRLQVLFHYSNYGFFQTLWPGGIFFTRVGILQREPNDAQADLKSFPGLNQSGGHRATQSVSFEEQLEAARRASNVKKLLLGKLFFSFKDPQLFSVTYFVLQPWFSACGNPCKFHFFEMAFLLPVYLLFPSTCFWVTIPYLTMQCLTLFCFWIHALGLSSLDFYTNASVVKQAEANSLFPVRSRTSYTHSMKRNKLFKFRNWNDNFGIVIRSYLSNHDLKKKLNMDASASNVNRSEN